MAEEKIRESSMADLWNVWFCELHKKRVGLNVKIKEFVYAGKSPYQEINIMDTYEFGRMLVLYGSIMTTEKDEFVYHEMITHVPLGAHPDPKEVLIIGGGDGGTLREVLKHPGVMRATMIEIDKMVVETCKQYLPTIGTAFDHPKARVMFEDGERFVSTTKDKFDVIVIDASDPIGPAEVLFQKPFHQNCLKRLNEGGILVTQSESPLFHGKTVRQLYRNLGQVFPIVKMYHAYIPTYPSGIWSFAFCSTRYDPFEKYDPKQPRWTSIETKYYNADVHRAAFALPNFMRELVEPAGGR